MPRITVGSETSALIDIHDEDHGFGLSVALIHGLPLQRRPARRHPVQRAGQAVTAHGGPHNVALTHPSRSTERFSPS
jgi:hypothetical protein